ncbi:hypothetical protein V1477_016106 [Vespula maculifrons]|uniref:Uncharacterized protein n=1 Tax=Vespula maculifrons TaxID=7453 RepID=A0ABD2BC29_VESMC
MNCVLRVLRCVLVQIRGMNEPFTASHSDYIDVTNCVLRVLRCVLVHIRGMNEPFTASHSDYIDGTSAEGSPLLHIRGMNEPFIASHSDYIDVTSGRRSPLLRLILKQKSYRILKACRTVRTASITMSTGADSWHE